MKRAYRFRFYPTEVQKAVLARTFGCVRVVYNFGLRLRTEAHYERRERLGHPVCSAALTLLKWSEASAGGNGSTRDPATWGSHVLLLHSPCGRFDLLIFGCD